MQSVAGRPAAEVELAVYQAREYIAGVRAHAEGGPMQGSWGQIEGDTPLSRGSFDAALYAAGGAMNAAQSVMHGEVRNAYALLRPPVHHSVSSRALAFCIFHNPLVP